MTVVQKGIIKHNSGSQKQSRQSSSKGNSQRGSGAALLWLRSRMLTITGGKPNMRKRQHSSPWCSTLRRQHTEVAHKGR